MLNDLIDDGAKLVIVVIGIVFGGIGIAVALGIAGQIVENSGHAPLQTTFQIGERMINTAGNIKDTNDLGIAVFAIIGALITAIIAIIKYFPTV